MGANFLIKKGNEELVYAQAGMADREAEKPIERNTIFRLYSMTKPVTAVAAAFLFRLSPPVSFFRAASRVRTALDSFPFLSAHFPVFRVAGTLL